jgi:hypothetical protein
MLEDHKRDIGFVVGIGLGLEWYYTLFYVVADFPGRSIPESKLAIAAITTDNVEVG